MNNYSNRLLIYAVGDIMLGDHPNVLQGVEHRGRGIMVNRSLVVWY